MGRTIERGMPQGALWCRGSAANEVERPLTSRQIGEFNRSSRRPNSVETSRVNRSLGIAEIRPTPCEVSVLKATPTGLSSVMLASTTTAGFVSCSSAESSISIHYDPRRNSSSCARHEVRDERRVRLPEFPFAHSLFQFWTKSQQRLLQPTSRITE